MCTNGYRSPKCTINVHNIQQNTQNSDFTCQQAGAELGQAQPRLRLRFEQARIFTIQALGQQMLSCLVSAGVIHDSLNLSNHSPIYIKLEVGK